MKAVLNLFKVRIGVAIALATQNILGDLFASLSIVLDKPFVVGDFIVVGFTKARERHLEPFPRGCGPLGGDITLHVAVEQLIMAKLVGGDVLERRNEVFRTPLVIAHQNLLGLGDLQQ